MADEPGGKRREKKRGPKGGIKHRPGRGHTRKSEESQKEKIGKRLKKRHKERADEAKARWAEYDKLPPYLQRILGEPPMPRPRK